MTSQRNNFIILGLVVVLIGVAAYYIFIRQPVAEATQLGLDLEGGVSANLQGYKTDGSEVTREEMDVASGVIRQRVDSLGVTEPEIQLQAQDQVVVNIPGITDTERAIEVIGRTAQLGFYEVLAVAGGQPVPGDQIEETKEDLREQLEGDPAFDEGTKILFEQSPAPQGGDDLLFGYVVPEDPGLTGEALSSATLVRDQAGRRQVQMELTGEGGEGFGDLSQEIVDNALVNGRPGNGQLAVVLDEDVISAPRVDQAIYGGTVVIENQSLPGGLPQEEAEELEIVLQTGALPVNMEVLSVTSIGPTLGSDSLRSGLLAALVGFVLVLVFLIVVYRALGVIADLALLIYAFLLWGLIVMIPITMTLPGIAGIVLSIGVAADANVVIFERIKEEIRRGKTPRTAVGIGYQKGFKAILDGNLATLITAFILFALSSGSVRGFAVLLVIGVILSMFTAVSVTRALLGVISGRGIRLSAGMMGVSKGSIAASERPGSRKAAGAR
ncbi:MAG: protein translocase subunit SecD [Actinomycetota bacterium]|nr:protein translocase subunit SecD [Actinomycetota bacterium]